MFWKFFNPIELPPRTHAHTLGAVITGYRVRDGEFEEVARGDPQRPQTFYPMKNFEVAKKGDIMAARCTFDGTRTNKTTRIGKSVMSTGWGGHLFRRFCYLV